MIKPSFSLAHFVNSSATVQVRGRRRDPDDGLHTLNANDVFRPAAAPHGGGRGTSQVAHRCAHVASPQPSDRPPTTPEPGRGRIQRPLRRAILSSSSR